MAVSSVSGSSSLYGTRNILTGLASGMDTESMIENAVSGYKLKISQLQQKRTKTEWKQEAYQSIINKMSVFSEKYTSYTSSNNLMSPSFFNSAVKTVARGKYADKVSATGRASSNVQIDRVLQLATSATYKLKGSVFGAQADPTAGSVTAAADGTLDLSGKTEIGKLSGTMTLTYGGSNSSSTFTINFDETKTYTDDVDASGKVTKSASQKLVDEINRQLSEQSITVGSNTYTGNDLLNKVVKAEVGADGNITFADPKGNNVYVSRATGSVQELLLGGEEPSSSAGSQIKKLTLDGSDWNGTVEKSNLSYLSGSSMEITLDGKTKTVKMPTLEEINAQLDKLDKEHFEATGQHYQYLQTLKDKLANGEKVTGAEYRDLGERAFVNALQDKIDGAFGPGKLTVSDKNGTSAGIQLQFEAAKGSTFSVKASKGNVLGLGENKSLTSYLNTDKTLGELMGKNIDWSKFEPAYVKDANGNPTTEYAKDSEGKQLYSFKVSGANGEVVEIGQFNENSKLSDVFNAMNNSEDSGVKVSYSKLTNEITFTAKDTGSNGQIKFEGLAAELFGTKDAADATSGYTKGQDAIFEASVNGTSLGQMTRSSNDVEMDGMTVTLKGTFGYNEDGSQDLSAEAVTFQTSADADKIVDVIKKMVEDYNAMATEIKNAYSTMPAQQSNGSYYEPMTSEEEEKYSESFIKNWNEKAKSGLLFADRDLSNLYSSLTSAISLTGENGAVLRNAGITVSYANGLSTLEFDEEKFRAALNKDPDKVRDAFTASTETGSRSNGLMQALKEPLDMYGKTTGGKGILVEKAGSVLAPSTMYNNTMQLELDDIDTQISRWQDKLSDKVDYYTNKFSKLEQLVQQMNSQSSYFSQLSGG